MAKPIKLTRELIEQMKEEFGRALTSVKMSDGRVSFTKALTYEKKPEDNVTILFEPVAYAKMLMLLHTFNDEVAWHGTVERLEPKLFVIKDIFVYPQEVTGATVTTDQEGYQQWLMELDDETFNGLHMQGHSHVRMGTTPSPVDTAFYDSILSQLEDDDWYIFMIFNKSLEHTCMVYDMGSNIMYENSDISIGIRCDNGDLEQFIADAKDDVVRKGYVSPASNYNVSTTSKGTASTAKADKSGKASDVKKNVVESPRFERNYGRSYPGYYGGYYGGPCYDSDTGEVVDFDEMIFGARNTEQQKTRPSFNADGTRVDW